MGQIKSGEGANITAIADSLREAGYSDVVDIATQTKNRNADTRRSLEIAMIKAEKDNPECLGDLDILMCWALGWTNPLRTALTQRLSEKIARDKANKPKPGPKSPKEIIDYSLGDPVDAIRRR